VGGGYQIWRMASLSNCCDGDGDVEGWGQTRHTRVRGGGDFFFSFFFVLFCLFFCFFFAVVENKTTTTTLIPAADTQFEGWMTGGWMRMHALQSE